MNFRNKLVFVPGKLFSPSLMFAGEAGAYLSEATFKVYSTSWEHSTLALPACRGQTL
jgi:hypothetical protein